MARVVVNEYVSLDCVMEDSGGAEGFERGGFPVVRAPDLDAALAWGRKLAEATTLPVEVRPLARYDALIA